MEAVWWLPSHSLLRHLRQGRRQLLCLNGRVLVRVEHKIVQNINTTHSYMYNRINKVNMGIFFYYLVPLLHVLGVHYKILSADPCAPKMWERILGIR